VRGFVMAYTPTYTTDDAAPMVVDLIFTIVAVLISFGAILGLVVLYRWLKGKKPLVPGF